MHKLSILYCRPMGIGLKLARYDYKEDTKKMSRSASSSCTVWLANARIRSECVVPDVTTIGGP